MIRETIVLALVFLGGCPQCSHGGGGGSGSSGSGGGASSSSGSGGSSSGSTSSSTASSSGSISDGGSMDVPQPPGPPPDLSIPSSWAQLPRTDAGHPIFLDVPDPTVGAQVQLAYDPNLDDPIRRWGHCVSRVMACRRANGGNVDRCIPLIERCADNRGGPGCCPPACLDAYAQARAQGTPSRPALERTILAAHCVQGFDSYLPDGGETP